MREHNSRKPGLLVSIRSVAEAAAAYHGGAILIDVKEPRHGSLGRADDATIAAVVANVAGRLPVSAALGELTEPKSAPYPGPGLTFVKWGLAGAVGAGDWQLHLRRRIEEVGSLSPGCRVVAVAYADWQEAGAPPVSEVLAFALRRPGSVLLVDTCRKYPGRSLLDHMGLEDVGRLCRECRQSEVRIALAGSLGRAEIAALLPQRPDWFAVRGAVCEQGDRGGTVLEERVRELVEAIA